VHKKKHRKLEHIGLEEDLCENIIVNVHTTDNEELYKCNHVQLRKVGA